jgi:hypothetical protein
MGEYLGLLLFVVLAGGIGIAISLLKRSRDLTTTSEGFGTPEIQMRMEVVKSLDDVPRELRDKIKESTWTLKEDSGVERTFHSLDEMPPEMRARIEQALKDRGAGQGPEAETNVTIQWLESVSLSEGKSEIGRTKVVDEIPTELRQQLEQLASPHYSGKFTFKFRGPDGRERTYHSLDELPPDARAVYDQLLARNRRPRQR